MNPEQSTPPVSQVLQAVEQTAQRIVASDDFVNRLARAIVALQPSAALPAKPTVGDLPVALSANNPEFMRHVVAEPRHTDKGNVLVLSQVPIQGGMNAQLFLQVKDASLLEVPTELGQRLKNYAQVLVIDEEAGNLNTRRFFTFESFGDEGPQLMQELQRQLETLPLQSCAFLYVNVMHNSPPPAQQPTVEAPLH